MLKRFIAGLLIAFCVTLAACPALLLGLLISQTGGDATGNGVFRALLAAALVVIATIVLLLVGCLALQSVTSRQDDHPTSDT